MKILFSSMGLRKRCTIDREAAKTWGTRAKIIRRRLDDLRAAETLEVMRNLPGKCHELSEDRKGQLSVHLDKNYRLIFEPADNPLPIKPDGGLDWSQVREIRVIEVEDYHG